MGVCGAENKGKMGEMGGCGTLNVGCGTTENTRNTKKENGKRNYGLRKREENLDGIMAMNWRGREGM